MLSFVALLLGLACAPSGGNPTSTPAPKPQGAGSGPTPVAGGAGPKQWPNPPAMAIDPNKQYMATISTNVGDMKAQLYAKEAPLAVNNFVFLARQNFYDGTPFHRIIAGFMVQTGDPTGTGRGGPGYRFRDELPKDREYERGTLAMANAGPDTQGSQFFICHADLKGKLPKNYTIFGKVTDGLDILDKIANTPVKASATGEPSAPTQDVHITTVTIEEQ
jgi:cyclophilin family peptidyl-prolyl cis-trans isomerase